MNATPDWPAQYAAAEALDTEPLIQRVTDLATQLRDGDHTGIDELVIAARVLAARYERGKPPARRRPGRPPRGSVAHPADTRLAEIQPGPPDERRIEVANLLSGIGSRRGWGFATTGAGFVREVFSVWSAALVPVVLRGYSLATLPVVLPSDRHARVVIYHTLDNAVGALLTVVATGASTDQPRQRLLDRIVGGEAFPWEPGGWDGD